MRGGLALAIGLLALSAAARADEPAPPEEPATEDATPSLQRRQYEVANAQNPYAITPHKPNFLLPLSYSHHPSNRGLNVETQSLDHIEVKFQLSFKVAAWRDVLGMPADLYFAYTGRSFWQAYNSQLSSPFRDTNHEPEMFLATHADWQLGPIRDVNVRFGINHQSNGQTVPLSRSWNRVYLGATGRWRHFFADAVLWSRIPEEAKTDPEDPEGDDNPNIERTVGQGEFSLGWAIGRKTVHVQLRNNLRRDNKGAITAAFTYPLNSKLKGYIEVFSGYGETLIDYDSTNERLSLGIALSDWP